jgi:hypothetical protein
MREYLDRYAERLARAVMLPDYLLGKPLVVSDAEFACLQLSRPIRPAIELGESELPPTLREWLGPANVTALGPWADVLREQPVPAGPVTQWHWDAVRGTWYGTGHGYTSVVLWPSVVLDTVVSGLDYLQKALFTRDPRVMPEPTPAAFPWDPYPDA